jgi:hypothetical protein
MKIDENMKASDWCKIQALAGDEVLIGMKQLDLIRIL